MTNGWAEAPTTSEIEFSNKDHKISKNLIIKGTRVEYKQDFTNTDQDYRKKDFLNFYK